VVISSLLSDTEGGGVADFFRGHCIGHLFGEFRSRQSWFSTALLFDSLADAVGAGAA